MKHAMLTAALAAAMLTACSPQEYGAQPSRAQLDWHDLEYYMFCHFGPNTFTDVEWGDGTEDPDVFAPESLDCRQWARIARDAGMKAIIITAKHHDGFCLWPSSYSTHTVAQSAWRGGRGDVLAELSEACREEGLLFGVYISPWDRNHPDYGTAAYNDVFAGTIREVHTAYGPVFEQWFDGAGGQDAKNKGMPYDWARFNATVHEVSPQAVIFSDVGPGCRWVGNERGYAGETNWAALDVEGFTPGLNAPPLDTLNRGNVHGACYVPAECDVSIRPGWFYSPSTDDKVKSVEQLMDIWFGSVGRGGNLLLNVPPDRRGMIHPADSARLMEFKAAREAFLAGAVGSASREGRAVKVPSGHEVSAVVVCEDIARGQKISSFVVEGMKDGRWSVLAEGTTVGHKRILRFEPCSCEKVRVRVTGSYGRSRISYTVI